MTQRKADILALCVWLILLLAVLRAQCHAQYMTLSMGTYQVEYDSVQLIPHTVEWMLSRENLGESRREPSWRFTEDSRVPSPRACHDDYTHSGFDRGHMVPAADRSSTISSMRQTFIMTNVCPQAPALNRGAWKRWRMLAGDMSEVAISCASLPMLYFGKPTPSSSVAIMWRFLTVSSRRCTVALMIQSYSHNISPTYE